MKKFYFIQDVKNKISYDKWALWFSAFSIVVSVLTVGASTWFYIDSKKDTEKFKAQDRNDFYAINSSMLKLDTSSQEIFNPIIKESPTLDSVDIRFQMNLKNISQYRTDVLGTVIFDGNNKLTIKNFLNPSNDSLFKFSSIDYTDYGYSILPNEYLTMLPNFSITLKHDELKYQMEFNYVVLYKNALGGHYAMSYNYFLDLIKERSFSNQLNYHVYNYRIEFKNRSSHFEIFTLEQFPTLAKKLKETRKTNTRGELI